MVVDIIKEEGPSRGLFLNSSKSSVWCPSALRAAELDQEDSLNRGIHLVREEGTVLLGSPIGSVDYERQVIQARIDKVGESSEDPQSEFVILRSCLSIPKTMFTEPLTLPTTQPCGTALTG